MHSPAHATATRVGLDLAGLQNIIDALHARGYDVVGPRVTGTAITYAPIGSVDDLPHGWVSEQGPGRYRLTPKGDEYFAFGPAVESIKRHLTPPVATIWSARREEGTLRFVPSAAPARPLACIGVRACELEALARYDRVLLGGPYVDSGYQARRASLFLVAVNCTHPAGTCFCASMGTGPRAHAGFDLALTELPSEAGAPPPAHRFVAEVGTAAGAELLAALGAPEASAADVETAQASLEAAATRMGRHVERQGLGADLARAAEHPQWSDVAQRCLACANCTMVCPTCFCFTIEDHTDLTSARMERRRRWDSCFTTEFSYVHGGSIRPSTRARYRQWLTHKFSSWEEQFGTPGCVGCGRCITWCPAGIDITEEIRRLREGQRPAATVA